LIVSQVAFNNLRNLSEQNIDFAPGFNVIWGQNGQGKTNIVEAIYLLSTTKSFRTSTLSDITKFGQSSTQIIGNVSSNIGEYELKFILEKEKKQVFINGNRENILSNYVGKLVAVVFSPSDLEIIRDGPAGRRKVIDKHLADISPGVVDNLINFSRALRSKSLIIKEGGADTQIEAWNSIMAREGVKITRKREELIREIEAEINGIYSNFAAADGEIALSYDGDFKNLSEEEALVSLNLAISRERARGIPLIGPQRDDFIITVNNHDAKSFCSQGQTRSIVIAMKLALLNILEARLKERPLVILDDVDSELDRGRSSRLFEFVKATSGQIFITGTRAPEEFLDAKNVTSIRVENGSIKQS
jgi:DNA replication and repair protein RecF